MIALVVAVGKNGEIGNKGSLPWGKEYWEDEAFYKGITKNNVRVGCRGAFQTTNDGRKFYVISTKSEPFLHALGIYNWKTHTPSEILHDIQQKHLDKDIFVIGGKEWYHSAAPFVEKIFISRINREFVHDVRIDVGKVLQDRKLIERRQAQHPDLCFEIYR